MKKLKKTLKIFGISTLSLAATLVILWIVPYRSEGTFYAWRNIQCLCDCKHFIRIDRGIATVYSIGDENTAFIAGRYTVDGKEVIDAETEDLVGILKSDINIIRSSVLGVTSSSEEGFLIRTLPFSSIHKALDSVNIEFIHKDNTHVHRDDLDVDYNLLHRKTLPLPISDTVAQ